MIVARLLLLGATQAEAAEAAGVGARTIRDWKVTDWWPDYVERARSTIHDQVEAYALRAVLESVREGDAQSARWVLERLRPDPWRNETAAQVAGSVMLTVEVPSPTKAGAD